MAAPSPDSPDATPPRPLLQDFPRVLRDRDDGQHVSGASRRLRALAALSGSLTDPLGPAEAADIVERQALSALGAMSAVVMTLGDFPPTSPPSGEPPTARSLRVVHAIGLPENMKATLDQLPLEAPVPLAEVARSGEPVFLDSEPALRRYQHWGDAMIRAGASAAAIVPVWANGELRGVLGLAWARPQHFDEDERAFVLTLGVMCAQAIMRAYLRTAEHEAREAAERANRSKTHFLATISHELRTPMNAVIGYTELLADEIDGPVTALQRERLGRVRTSGKHLLGLIEQLLGYARIEAGEETMGPEAVLLADIVEQSLVLVRPIAEQKGVSIMVEDRDAPAALYTDALKLRQILVNLLANALKFTDAGGDVVLLHRVDDREGETMVCFEVTDSGKGIAPSDEERIFDAFWQADPTLTRSAGGTGLGLWVARKLARLLGGDVILARSAPGRGSTFVASLPARYVPV